MRPPRTLAAAVLALFAGCTRGPAPPPSPATYAAWHDEVTGCRFERPVNWPVRAAVDAAAELVMIEATPRERLVVTHLVGEDTTPLSELTERVEQRVRQKFPDARAETPADATVAGAPARRIEFTLDRGASRGVRYVVDGGWVVETETRTAYADQVEPAFERIIESLALPNHD